ncbi:MAG: hypothetical protein N2749_02420 [Clostridia bacterium]|nr:hypothetical protein [Clostridia bacterium]
MKKNFNKILIVFITLIFIFNIGIVNATDFWGGASDWFKGGSITDIPKSAQEVIKTIEEMLNVIGTSLFVIVTVFLGIKYMYGSIESKSEVKESLLTLVVAAFFFFGWTSLRNLLYPGNVFILTENLNTYQSVVTRIFSISMFIANFLAVAAIIYVGLKYMLSGASGKADMKAKSGQFLIGIVLAFASINFLSYLSKVINAVLQQ